MKIRILFRTFLSFMTLLFVVTKCFAQLGTRHSTEVIRNRLVNKIWLGTAGQYFHFIDNKIVCNDYFGFIWGNFTLRDSVLIIQKPKKESNNDNDAESLYDSLFFKIVRITDDTLKFVPEDYQTMNFMKDLGRVHIALHEYDSVQRSITLSNKSVFDKKPIHFQKIEYKFCNAANLCFDDQSCHDFTITIDSTGWMKLVCTANKADSVQKKLYHEQLIKLDSILNNSALDVLLSDEHILTDKSYFTKLIIRYNGQTKRLYNIHRIRCLDGLSNFFSSLRGQFLDTRRRNAPLNSTVR